MSIPREPDPAQLIMSVLISREDILPRLQQTVEAEFGEIEDMVGPLGFDFTTYYETELGPNIKRWLWSFAKLVDMGALADIKRRTNEIEQESAADGKRRCNIDPGLLSLWNFVLATGKVNAHRIYLGSGIFADLTLIFRSSSYQPLPWTYPDYASIEMRTILNDFRKRYKWKLQNTAKSRQTSTA
uniref:DUF4416 family protein n=1 Tax=Desulfomonile tiedjei TaxID=2358 RepID=A0A7C4ATM3_9BACT